MTHRKLGTTYGSNYVWKMEVADERKVGRITITYMLRFSHLDCILPKPPENKLESLLDRPKVDTTPIKGVITSTYNARDQTGT